MNDCLFCKILNKKISSHIIYEDNNALAFLDITPVVPGHTLLIPKKHSRNILDIENEDMKKLSPLIKKISLAIKETTGADGINVHINNEPAAGQVIFHTHIHLIPRFFGDGLKMWRGEEIDQEKLKKISQQISNKIQK